MKKLKTFLAVAGIFGAGYVAGAQRPFGATEAEAAAPESRVYEARIYTTHDGRLEALHKRFQDHTLRLFERHGMTNVGYWVPEDSARTLIFVISHPSRETARENWRTFMADPEWQAARAASEEDGPIVRRAESIFLEPTSYSPLK
jgi:hypothetical protein